MPDLGVLADAAVEVGESEGSTIGRLGKAAASTLKGGLRGALSKGKGILEDGGSAEISTGAELGGGEGKLGGELGKATEEGGISLKKAAKYAAGGAGVYVVGKTVANTQNPSECLQTCSSSVDDDFFYQLSKSDKRKYSNSCGGEKDYSKRKSDICKTFCTSQDNNPNDKSICSKKNRSDRARAQAETDLADSAVGQVVGAATGAVGDAGDDALGVALGYLKDHWQFAATGCGILILLFFAKSFIHVGGGKGKLKGGSNKINSKYYFLFIFFLFIIYNERK